ncbi:hypothetical protein HY994_06465 [Candidatus Micrarchaeota archaeon]|nr:hypothetical protein [Candidatus Micrarchaeota archaeon]
MSTEHAHGSSDSSSEMTRNLQALHDEESRLKDDAIALVQEKQALLDSARKKAQALLDKAREKAESEREKILSAMQAKVDAEKNELLKKADRDAAALRKKKLNLTSKLLPLVFP